MYAQLPILLVFPHIFIYLRVSECGLIAIYLSCQSRLCCSVSPVTHFNDQTGLPCHTARAYHKEHTGICVCLCKTSPRVLVGLISVFRVCPVQVKTVDPSVWIGRVKPTETGDVQRQELNQCWLGKG